MMKLELLAMTAVPCRVGESPIWDGEAGRIRWCDIDGQAIWSCHLDGGDPVCVLFDEPVGAIGLAGDGWLWVALRRTVGLWHVDRGRFETVADIELGSPAARLNDGKVAPDGSFWIGSTALAEIQARSSSLYRVGGDGKVTVKATGLGISNGLAFHGGRVFLADTATGALGCYTETAGPLADPLWSACLTREDGLPDGGLCDEQGRYLSAGVTAGCLNIFAGDGRHVQRMPVPVSAPTSLAFAGPCNDHLVVTSLRRPQSGRHDGKTLIFKYRQGDASEPL